MQFTFTNSQALRAELAFVLSAIEKKATIPALQNFCLEPLDNNLLRVTATDTDISASTTIEIKSYAKKEPALVNARKLTDLLIDLPNNAECSLTQLETNWLELKSGKSKYKIAGESRENFPELEKHNLSDAIELPGLKFIQLIQNTQIAITQEESQRFALNGAQLRMENGSCAIIATDGHRLALSSFPFIRPSETDDIKVLIPKKTLGQVLKMFDSISGEKVPDFFFSYSENQIKFQLGEKVLYSRTLSGQFPNYTLVLPQEGLITINLTVPLIEFRQAVKRVTKMAEGKTPGIKLFFGDNSLTLVAQDSVQGKGEEIIDINNLIAFDLGVNSNYLMAFLNQVDCVDCDELKLKFKNPQSQCLLEPVKSEVEYKYVIMPMRI